MSSINIVVCAEKTEYKVAVKNKIVNDELSIIGYADFQPESKMRIQGFVPDVVVFVLDSDEITPEFLTFVEDINLGSFGCSAIIMTDNVTVDLVNNAAQSGIRRVMNVNIGNEEFLNTVKSIVGNEKKHAVVSSYRSTRSPALHPQSRGSAACCPDANLW